MKDDCCGNDDHFPPFLQGKSPLQKGLAIAGMVIGGIALAVVFALVFGAVVMLLWNWIMPEVFGLKVIGYWQGFGLVLIAKILFGNPGSPKGGDKKRHPHKGDHGPFSDFPSSRENWKEFRNYWNEKGKGDFEEYIRTKNEEPKQEA
ncbi:MAG: hypothetical protein HPY53_09185 [Brevinematales bacterium]|nr:hypothetical protein [Brevinematales bacterium]